MTDQVCVYVDTNLFVYAVESHDDPIGDRARQLLATLRDQEVATFTSELTLAETLVRPHRLRQTALVRSYLALFNGRGVIRMRPVTRHILTESAIYRSRVHPRMPDPTEDRRNFLPDAIHVVTAVDIGATHYIGSDDRIRLPVGIMRLDPRESRTLDALTSSL